MSELIEIKLYDLIELSLCISDCDLDQEETISVVLPPDSTKCFFIASNAILNSRYSR